MSVESVNGFVCYDCRDVSLAKRGIDPAEQNPAAKPAPKVRAAEAPAASALRDDPVKLSDQLKAIEEAAEIRSDKTAADQGRLQRPGSLVDVRV